MITNFIKIFQNVRGESMEYLSKIFSQLNSIIIKILKIRSASINLCVRIYE